MLQIGDIAPDFTLPCIDSAAMPATLALASLRGQAVVIFFYPRDATSTCTREAQNFSRLAAEFAARGAHLVGISKDGIAAHMRFQQKQSLRLTLASDAGSDTCERYGAWGQKMLYGRTYTGILRTTFLIDRAGRITAIWRGVKVAGHAEAVLAAIQSTEN
ncbi:MAG: peroxiredoxin [Phaeovulum sp.]|nr:peroxiredoxin [Phaeovulum sp.]MDP3862247.1 peroxiredoxin [Phaeovulum sp.]